MRCRFGDTGKFLHSIVAKEPVSWDTVWFVGDNFASHTYRKYFLKPFDKNEKKEHEEPTPGEFHIKRLFDYNIYCNSRYSSATENMLIRIQNSFVSMINKNADQPLAKYFLVVLDDDLITFLDFKGPGVTSLLGSWLEWLIKNFREAIMAKKKLLPEKSVQKNEPCVYWVLAPMHCNCSHERNQVRQNLNFALETILKGKSDMRVIKFKEFWQYNDKSLVNNDKITESGLFAYWKAVDAAFHFNILRHEVFLAKCIVNEASKRRDTVTSVKEDCKIVGMQRAS